MTQDGGLGEPTINSLSGQVSPASTVLFAESTGRRGRCRARPTATNPGSTSSKNGDTCRRWDGAPRTATPRQRHRRLRGWRLGSCRTSSNRQRERLD